MKRRHCDELGLCQVEAARAFGLPAHQHRACATCNHPAATAAIDEMAAPPAVVVPVVLQSANDGLLYPFAPGVIEHFERDRRGRWQRVAAVVAVVSITFALAVIGGVLAGYARGKGWL